MTRHPLLLTLITLMSALASEAQAQSNMGLNGQTPNVPKVVVNILIDQLRSDYLEAFTPLYGNDGLKLLLRDGCVFTAAEYPLAHPDRASAAATIATGTTAADHGIVGMQWMNRETLRPMYCVEDRTVKGLVTVDQYSPKWLNVSTISDELKVATDGAARVFSIAPNADAAILSAGHAADHVVWIDDQTGFWSSSSYYGHLPIWADQRNIHQGLEQRLKKNTWIPYNTEVGGFSYFLSGTEERPFQHQFKGNQQFVSFKTSGLVNDEVAEVTRAAIEDSDFGDDSTTDYLAVTLYAGNFEHNSVNAMPLEIQDTYVRLDNAIASIIEAVEKKVGRGNALYALTSTGYVEEEAADLSKYRIPTGTFDMTRATSLLGMYMVAVYGQGDYIESTLGTEIYFNHKVLEERQINISEFQNRAQDLLLQLAGVKDVFTAQRLLQGAWTPGISRMRGGFNPQRSGDVSIQVQPGWKIKTPDYTMGNSNFQSQIARESYVAFPIIFYGTGISHEIITTPVSVDCIAPTLSKAMRIRAPNACSKAPIK